MRKCNRSLIILNIKYGLWLGLKASGYGFYSMETIDSIVYSLTFQSAAIKEITKKQVNLKSATIFKRLKVSDPLNYKIIIHLIYMFLIVDFIKLPVLILSWRFKICFSF